MTTQRERVIGELKGSSDRRTAQEIADRLGIGRQTASAILSDLVNHHPEHGIWAFKGDGNVRTYAHAESRPSGALKLNGRKKKKAEPKPAVVDVTPLSPVQTFATPYGRLEVYEKDAVLKMTHADALLLLGTSRG